eukprot:scaffold12417_cov131-Isochrysis_galbana.AAC.1
MMKKGKKRIWSNDHPMIISLPWASFHVFCFENRVTLPKELVYVRLQTFVEPRGGGHRLYPISRNGVHHKVG